MGEDWLDDDNLESGAPQVSSQGLDAKPAVRCGVTIGMLPVRDRVQHPFLSWLRDSHGRTRVMKALVDELLSEPDRPKPSSVLMEMLWPHKPNVSSVEVFRRHDRFRRLLSDLRVRIAEYNSLSAPIHGRLYLQTESGSVALLETEKSRPDATGCGDPARADGDPHLDALHYIRDTTTAARWAAVKPRNGESGRIAEWLMSRDVTTRRLCQRMGRAGTACVNCLLPDESRGEELVRLGCACEAERLARHALEASLHQPGRSEMLALWGEAACALGMSARLARWVDALQARVQADPETTGRASLRARIRRMRVHAHALASLDLETSHAVFLQAIEEAEGEGIPMEADQLRLRLGLQMLFESQYCTKPALLRRAIQQFHRMIRDVGESNCRCLENELQFAYWLARGVNSRRHRTLLEESREMAAWLPLRRNHALDVRMRAMQMRLLAGMGNYTGAHAAARDLLLRCIRSVDRENILFHMAEYMRVVERSGGSQVRRLKKAAQHLVVRLFEITRETPGWPGPQVAAKAAGDAQTEPQHAARDLAQLAPMAADLGDTLECDWIRLLGDLPVFPDPAR